VGDGHPPFSVQFANVTCAADGKLDPARGSGRRMGSRGDQRLGERAGKRHSSVDVAENQSIRSSADNSGAPYTVAQGINGDSWDNWNQDRDQAIAQEASQQTPVRDDSANPQNENWNDLDADGNWYPG
jgi:hypothetical protein